MVIRAARRSSSLQVKRVPSFLSYFKTLSIGPSPGIEPATSRSAVKRSSDWANPARPITIKFRIRKESSKPQTNYHWCLRFSYLAPYWVISRNTITCHKYFWCWNWKGLPCNEKVSTTGTYRFHELLNGLKFKNFKPFLDTPIRRGIISSGTRSFLTVTETLAGTLGGLKKHLTASIGTVELRILIRGCLQSSPLMPTMLKVEPYQPCPGWGSWYTSH